MLATRPLHQIKNAFPGIASGWMWIYLIAMLGLSVYTSQAMRGFGVPDESAHYFRAREVSLLHFINSPGKDGVTISCDEYKLVGTANGPIANLVNVDEIPVTPNTPCTIKTINTAGTYSPVLYLFSALGFSVADQLHYDYQRRQFMGRLFNAAGNSIIIFMALCLINNYRPLLATLALTPVAFFLRASLSADAVSTSFSFFYICFILRKIEQNSELRTNDILLFSIISIFVGATKPFFSIIPFATLVFLTNKPGNMSAIKWITLLMTPGIASVITAGLFTRAADPALIYVSGGSSIQQQFLYIVHHPINFLMAYLHTSAVGLIPWLIEIVGGGTTTIAIFYGVILGLLCFTSENKLSPYQRFIFLVLSIALSGANAAALYMTYSPIGYTEVLGLQGRLFVISLLLIFIAIGFNRPGWIFLSSALKTILGYVFPFLLLLYCLRYQTPWNV